MGGEGSISDKDGETGRRRWYRRRRRRREIRVNDAIGTYFRPIRSCSRGRAPSVK